MRHFWWDLFRLVTTDTVDNASYHVHIQLAQHAIRSHTIEDEPSAALVKAQDTLLQELVTGNGLKTGLHMEQLWQKFRPQLVPSVDRIAGYETLKALAHRFDATVFPLRAPIEDLARTREYLQFALRASLVEDVDVAGLIEAVSKAITPLRDAGDATASKAIFQAQFEAIYQFLRGRASRTDVSQLALLAGRPSGSEHDLVAHTAQSTPLQDSLVHLSSFACDAMTQASPSAVAGGLSSSLLGQLKQVGQVSLSELEQLRTELHAIGDAVATQAHVLCKDLTEDIARALRQQVVAWGDVGLPVEGLPALDIGLSAKNELGRDLVRYSVGCLLAYVPDRAFDPALKEQIQRRLIIARRDASTEKLRALQGFEQFFTGQTESMRIDLARWEIADVGNDAPELQIARPEKSQLNQLQGDFVRVIEIVRQADALVKDTSLAIDDSIMQNIALLVKRLAENYTAYRDLVIPAVQWLQCLWLGLKLVKQWHTQASRATQDNSPWSLVHRVASARAIDQLPSSISTLEGMRYVALARSVDSSKQILVETASSFFENLFLTWKDKVA